MAQFRIMMWKTNSDQADVRAYNLGLSMNFEIKTTQIIQQGLELSSPNWTSITNRYYIDHLY